jgi:hypothetical protein
MTHFSLKEGSRGNYLPKFSNHEDIGRKEINIQLNGLCNDKKSYLFSYRDIFIDNKAFI